MIQPIIEVDQGEGPEGPFCLGEMPFYFMPLIEGDSLFQDCLERVSDGIFEPPIVLVSQRYEAEVRAQADEIAFDDVTVIVCEDTAQKAEAIRQIEQTADFILSCPVEGYVADQGAFITAVEAALLTAQQGYGVYLGAVAQWPNVACGYIQVGQRLDTRWAGHHILDHYDAPTADQVVTCHDAQNWVWNTDIKLYSPQQENLNWVVVSLLGAWTAVRNWPSVWYIRHLLMN